jgi:hypothetical protein
MWGLSSLDLNSFGSIYTLNWQMVPGFFGSVVQFPDGQDKLWHVLLPESRLIPKKARVSEGSINVQPLSVKNAIRLLANAKAEAALAQRRAKGWVPIRSESEFHHKFDWRFGPSP